MKLFKVILCSLLSLGLAIILFAYYSSNAKLNKIYATKVQSIDIPTDNDSISQGKHLIQGIAHCTGCHGSDLGGNLEKEIPFFAVIRGPNITQGEGSVTRNYKDEDWVRAIRHGVRPNGTPLIFMPATTYRNFSSSDLGSMIAAIKTFPPVNRKMEPASVGPVGRIVMTFSSDATTSILPAEHINHDDLQSVNSITQKSGVEYGKYLTQVGGCVHCHGANLTGGRIPGTPPSIPPATNLTPSGVIAKYSPQEFIQLLRTGKRPDGSILNEIMPWKGTAHMRDEELLSIYEFLKSLPSSP